MMQKLCEHTRMYIVHAYHDSAAKYYQNHEALVDIKTNLKPKQKRV